ncbi:hypothetical protein D1007_57397 [Hordeum vulgare]|nr:hypothetical protein D1007_57397 [Hordeum vulgare]
MGHDACHSQATAILGFPEGTSYAELYTELMRELEGVSKKVYDIMEEECRNLFNLATTIVFSHLILRNPCFKSDEVMDPMLEESRNNLAAVVEGHVSALLGKFFCIDGEDPDEEPPVIVS